MIASDHGDADIYYKIMTLLTSHANAHTIMEKYKPYTAHCMHKFHYVHSLWCTC